MKKNLISLLSVLVFSVGVNLESKAKEGDDVSLLPSKISITGLIKKELNLKVEDLKKLKISEIKDLPIINRGGTLKGTVKSYKGVLLKNIIKSDDIDVKNWKELNEIYVLAEATDGYKVVFSLNELVNSPLGEGILLAFEKNGKALDDSEGKIILISAKDLKTGPRHIKWLKTISIKKV